MSSGDKKATGMFIDGNFDKKERQNLVHELRISDKFP